MTTARIPLSVCIITRNEERRLPICLESVKCASEIIVVDDYSTDATREICRSHNNVRFVSNRFQGFGQQKRYAVSLAQHDWVLNVDADEEVTPQLIAEIAEAINSNNSHSGYFVRRKNLWFGKYYLDNYPGALRLFRTSCGNFQEDYVHEKVVLEGATGQFEGVLLHHPASFESFKAHYLTYVLKYGDLAARDYVARGRRITAFNAVWKIVLLPVAVFTKKYVFGKAFLRGKAGLYVSICSAMCYSLAYLKVLKYQIRKSFAP